jgi:hypothetical protein
MSEAWNPSLSAIGCKYVLMAGLSRADIVASLQGSPCRTS